MTDSLHSDFDDALLAAEGWRQSVESAERHIILLRSLQMLVGGVVLSLVISGILTFRATAVAVIFAVMFCVYLHGLVSTATRRMNSMREVMLRLVASLREIRAATEASKEPSPLKRTTTEARLARFDI